jgi:hypothetical protein
MLEADITQLVAAGASADRDAVREAFGRVREAHSSGAVRAAGSDREGPEWLSLSTPVIVTYRDSRTATRTEFEAWIR